VLPGTPISLPIQASDADALDLVHLTSGPLPAGANISISSDANPASASLTWTPGAGQLGSYQIAVSATDSTGRTTSYTVTIDVVSQIFLPAVRR
jgi:hypothetical protein